MLFESFKQGINLGGFLSQYELIADAGSEESLHNHFETFITEDDIRRIASWGFDHVRIPMDGYLFYNSEKKNLNTEPLEYLDRCVEWCAVHGVNAVIDLHNIKGHIAALVVLRRFLAKTPCFAAKPDLTQALLACRNSPR